MHQAGYEALDLRWVYVPFAVRPEDLAGALAGMRGLAIRGFGVSMPFKIDVLPLLDRLDPLAQRIGAANTIVNDDGVLSGHNTDAEGAARALEEAIGSLAGARCTVLGAGGAARAVVHGLAARGAVVSVANRTRASAETLAREAGATTIDWSERAATSADVIVNATSAGMDIGAGPTESPLAGTMIPKAVTVMDIVYKPIETNLIADARAAGARVVSGGRMLLYQAASQFELYTGQKAPLEAMDRALVAAIGG
ncbi:MAG: shikimate dehydrogenase [Polyangiaceae bacterium]|nr:shikimate dehydrogenase [Polyangiaceae bacterium]